MKNKIVVISGGSGYLGRHIVSKLLNRGFIVFSINRKMPPEERVPKDKNLHFFSADVSDGKALKKISEVAKKIGKIRAVIHAASAPLVRRPILENTMEEFRSQFFTNVFGCYELAKCFCPLMEAGSVVIAITSDVTKSGRPYFVGGSYVPAKVALDSLMKIISHELETKHIRTCIVSPAFMPGGLNSDMPEAVREFIMSKSKPEEISDPEKVATEVVELVCMTNR